MNTSSSDNLIPKGLLARAIAGSRSAAWQIRLGALSLKLWALTAGAVMIAAAALSLAGWPLQDRSLLLSAVITAAAAPWIYTALFAASAIEAASRLTVGLGTIATVAIGGTDALALGFLLQAAAASHAARDSDRFCPRMALLAWTGSALTMALLCLVALS